MKGDLEERARDVERDAICQAFEAVLFDEQLDETRARCATMDELCQAVGRDPATLQRSYTMFDTQARHHDGMIAYYESPDRFAEKIGRAHV